MVVSLARMGLGRPRASHRGRRHAGPACSVRSGAPAAGGNAGVKLVSDRTWLVSFIDSYLGYFDDETCSLEPIENPFSPSVLPMPPE
jgi:hypothetical protein